MIRQPERVFVTLAVLGMLTACQLTAPPASVEGSPPAGAAAVEKPQGFLWRISREGGDSPSHLLGTLAIGDIPVRDLPETVRELLQSCRVFVVKMDVSKVVEDEMVELARYPEGETLEEKLTPAQWSTLRQLTRNRIPARVLTTFRPWFVLPNVHASLVPRSSPAGQPIDVELLLEARRRGRTIVGLEDWKTQMETVREVFTVAVLQDTLDRLDAVRQRLRAQAQAYADGERAELESILFDPREVERHPRLFEELIRKRNEAWIGRIEQELEAGDAFLAIGLEHLLGSSGLLQELERRGWVLERL